MKNIIAFVFILFSTCFAYADTISIVITEADGKPYWHAFFADQTSADNWLAITKAQPNWVASRVITETLVKDTGPTDADRAAAAAAIQSDKQGRKAALKAVLDKFDAGTDQPADLKQLIKLLGKERIKDLN